MSKGGALFMGCIVLKIENMLSCISVPKSVVTY